MNTAINIEMYASHKYNNLLLEDYLLTETNACKVHNKSAQAIVCNARGDQIHSRRTCCIVDTSNAPSHSDPLVPHRHRSARYSAGNKSGAGFESNDSVDYPSL
jgi:hypothetical protein